MDVKNLLRKKDVVEKVGAPKSTVNDWIHDFSAFIPRVQNGRTIYYRPQAVDVLLKVKEMREMGLDKTQISLELSKLFPINEDEVEAKIEKSVDRSDEATNRDALLTVMQTMGKAMERMTEIERELQEVKEQRLEQEKLNEELKKKLEEQQRYIDEKLKKRDEKLMESLREVQEVKKQIAAAKEERKNKGFFARLFGK
jgi:predicted  nucleic acid-binding Zn-ribbon protein